MHEHLNWWEVASSVSAFIGGGILAIDAFRARGNTKVRISAREFEEEVRKLMAKESRAEDVPPGTVSDDLEMNLAKRTRLLTIWGFGVITGGFLLDLLVKLHVL